MELVRPYVSDIFVETTAVKHIRLAIDNALGFEYPVYIESAPGYGKTTALWYLTEEFKGNYCLIGASQKSVPDMYRTLLSAFGFWHDSTYQRDLYNTLVSRLGTYYPGGTRKLLVVDEFQTLEAAAKRELLNIQETCGLALVLSGNSERLFGDGKKDKAAMDQIESRIGIRIKLSPLSVEDCQKLGTAFNVEGSDAYRAISYYGLNTSIRALVRVLKQAQKMTGDVVGIRLNHIEMAVIALHGSKEKLSLLEKS